MNQQTLLQNLGLTDKEAATYLAILELGSSTIKPIADKAGLKRTSVYNFIDDLVEMGLVTRHQRIEGTHYQAAPPTELLDIQQRRLELVKEHLPELASMFNASTLKPRIHYFEGPNEVRNIFKEVLKCKKEVLHLFPGTDIIEMIGGVQWLEEIDRQRIKQKLPIRTIRFREKDVTFKTSASGKAQLRELRFAPTSFHTTMGMGIYDTGKVSYWSSEKEGFGILIESVELETLMRNMYELLWLAAEPVEEGVG